MDKLYDRIIFENGTVPALNDTNLNAMSKALDDIDDRVILLADDVLVVIPQIQAYLEQAQTIEEALEQLSQNPPYIGANGHWYTFDTSTEQYVDSGVDASISVQIADITMLAEGATPYVTNTGTDTDPVFHLFIPVGATGNGIASIAKTGTSGNVDTYTITMTDGTTATFTVTNATSGSISTLSDVTLNNLSNGQVLKYNSTSQKWENANESGGSSSLNDLTDVIITSASNGQVLTKTSNGWENANIPSSGIDDLTDVDITSEGDGQILVYDSNAQKWKNQSALKSKADKTDLASISETGSTSSQAITASTYFYLNEMLVKALTDIASGATFTLGTNYEVVSTGALNKVNVWTLIDTVNTTTAKTVTIPDDAKEILVTLRTSSALFGSITVPKAEYGRNISLKNPADTSKEVFKQGNKWKVTDSSYIASIYYK